MRTTRSVALGVLAAGALGAASAGCELVTKIDHTALSGGGDEATPTSKLVAGEQNTSVPACAGGVASCGVETDCPGAPECKEPTCVDACCGTKSSPAGATCKAGVCDGEGACVECTTEAQCPAPGACKAATCAEHTCGAADLPADTVCTAGDGRVCDGSGACVECNDSTQGPAPATACKLAGCASHACVQSNAGKGESCSDRSGKVCDGAGRCVQCNSAADCPGGACHGTNVCVPAPCADGSKDGSETDVDCGGDPATCPPRCGQFQLCKVPSDCQSGVCDTLSHTCG